jgi:iron complex outermembrane recepter protein
MFTKRLPLARGHLVMTVSMAALTIAAPAAWAQTPPPAGTETALEEIVVTAQRQAQSLQDVPIAVSAFTADGLDKAGIEGASDIVFALPNVTFTKTNFTSSSFQIRGIGSNAVGATTDASTGVHVNDIPFDSRIFETEFFDVERVEVLRGPQGTQFGRNATGGVLNVLTKRPTDEFTAEGELGLGNYKEVKFKGAVNIPLSDKLKARFAGTYLNRDGYTENLYTGNRIDGRNQFALRGSLRWEPGEDTTIDLMASYFKENSNRSRIQKQLCHRDVTGIYGCLPDELRFETANGNAFVASTLPSTELLGVLGFGALAPALSLGSVAGPDSYAGVVNIPDYRKVRLDYEPTYKSDETVLQLALKHDFGKVKGSINLGYSKNGVDSTTDYTLAVTNNINLPAAIANPALGGPLAPSLAQIQARLFRGNEIGVSAIDGSGGYTGFIGGNILRYARNTTEYDRSVLSNRTYSIEAILNTNLDGPLNFLLGGIYYDSKVGPNDYYVASSGLDYASALLGATTGRAFAAPYFNSETQNYTLKSKAVFGEVYFDFSDTLKLTAGLRYTNDKKFVRDRQVLLNTPIAYGSTSALPALATAAPFREATVTLNKVTGRVVLDWKPTLSFTDDTLIYASFSRGAKPGGINPPFDPVLFPSATVGFKPETINAFEVGTKNRLADGHVQVNLTAFYYDYKDLQISRIVQRTSFNDNTDAKIWGLEGEFIYKPIDPLLLSLTASYLKTKIAAKSVLDPSNVTAGRSDVFVLKDLQTAAQCVVTPTAGGLPVTAALQTVGGTLTALGTNPGLTPILGAATQAQLAQLGSGTTAAGAGAFTVPGTTHKSNFGLCAILRGAQATISSPALAPLLAALPAGARFTVSDGIESDITGNELQNSPHFKLSAAIDYSHEFASEWTINGRIDYSYQSSTYGRVFNLSSDKLAGFSLVNARLGVASPNKRWSMSAYVQNIGNKTAITGLYVTDQNSGLFRNVFTTEPRRFGASVGFKF